MTTKLPEIMLHIGMWATFASSQYVDSENGCDWTVWDTTVKQGVRTVHPLCNSGHIGWHHPYGAVRVTLSAPNNLPFLACFMARTHATTALISVETDATSSTSYQEHDKPFLEKLVALDKTLANTEKEICIVSEKGKSITLYLEAEMEAATSVIGRVEVEYDVERWTPSESSDPMEDCRPCTEEEILKAACSSDFVVVGSMDSVVHSPADDETELKLSVSKVYRQAHDLFSQPSNNAQDPHMEMGDHLSNHLMHHTNSRSSMNTDKSTHIMEQTRTRQNKEVQHFGSVVAPHRCGIRHGDGQYVFMGKVRLKRGILKCAPRIEEFESLWKRAEEKGRNMCVLE